MARSSTHNIVGQLREFITIQRHEVSQDESGFEIKAWNDISRVRAKVSKMLMEDKEAYGFRKSWDGKSGIVTTMKTYVFTMRETDVRNLDRIMYKGEAYEIREIEELTINGRYLTAKAIQIC